MPPTRRKARSAQDIKALAHPVRLDLLDLLAAHGPLTATEAAGMLDQTPANVSWHLRTLGGQGFVRQATGGPGRRRPWKAVRVSMLQGDDAEDHSAADYNGAAVRRDVAMERELGHLREALAHRVRESPPWQEATTVVTSRLWLTPDEARALGDRITELLSSQPDRDDPARRPAHARSVVATAWLGPRQGMVTSAHPASHPVGGGPAELGEDHAQVEPGGLDRQGDQ